MRRNMRRCVYGVKRRSKLFIPLYPPRRVFCETQRIDLKIMSGNFGMREMGVRTTFITRVANRASPTPLTDEMFAKLATITRNIDQANSSGRSIVRVESDSALPGDYIFSLVDDSTCITRLACKTEYIEREELWLAALHCVDVLFGKSGFIAPMAAIARQQDVEQAVVVMELLAKFTLDQLMIAYIILEPDTQFARNVYAAFDPSYSAYKEAGYVSESVALNKYFRWAALPENNNRHRAFITDRPVGLAYVIHLLMNSSIGNVEDERVSPRDLFRMHGEQYLDKDTFVKYVVEVRDVEMTLENFAMYDHQDPGLGWTNDQAAAFIRNDQENTRNFPPLTAVQIEDILRRKTYHNRLAEEHKRGLENDDDPIVLERVQETFTRYTPEEVYFRSKFAGHGSVPKTFTKLAREERERLQEVAKRAARAASNQAEIDARNAPVIPTPERVTQRCKSSVNPFLLEAFEESDDIVTIYSVTSTGDRMKLGDCYDRASLIYLSENAQQTVKVGEDGNRRSIQVVKMPLTDHFIHLESFGRVKAGSVDRFNLDEDTRLVNPTFGTADVPRRIYTLTPAPPPPPQSSRAATRDDGMSIDDVTFGASRRVAGTKPKSKSTAKSTVKSTTAASKTTTSTAAPKAAKSKCVGTRVNGVYACPTDGCDFASKHYSAWMEHCHMHEGLKSHTCSECSFKSCYAKSLRNHCNRLNHTKNVASVRRAIIADALALKKARNDEKDAKRVKRAKKARDKAAIETAAREKAKLDADAANAKAARKAARKADRVAKARKQESQNVARDIVRLQEKQKKTSSMANKARQSAIDALAKRDGTRKRVYSSDDEVI